MPKLIRVRVRSRALTPLEQWWYVTQSGEITKDRARAYHFPTDEAKRFEMTIDTCLASTWEHEVIDSEAP